MATQAALTAFKRTWGEPNDFSTRSRFQARTLDYQHRWHRYDNSIFEDRLRWERYRTDNGLYKNIRSIYNPTRRIVNFYAGIVYPGVLAVDANRLPNGTPLAIPLADDIDKRLADAIGQLWQWSNWQSGKSLFVRYGAALGDVAAEIVDEPLRGKVTFNVLWPGLISYLKLDFSGNVKEYHLEYDIEDEDGNKYTYRKEVTQDSISEYKDDNPHSYETGVPAQRANPYGFVPLVWCKHTDEGSDYGAPATRNVGKIDELNELASHAHDRTHNVLSSPMVISGEGVKEVKDQLDVKAPSYRDQWVRDEGGDTGNRERVRVFMAAQGGSISSVQLPSGEVMADMKNLLVEIERDHPELTMYEQLRAMSNVTGPGAEVMVGDAATNIYDARANYDLQTVKLHQMAVAIGGWRVQTGAWGRTLSRQQQAFAPFNLDSYKNGDLDFEIQPRPLMPMIQADPSIPTPGKINQPNQPNRQPAEQQQESQGA